MISFDTSKPRCSIRAHGCNTLTQFNPAQQKLILLGDILENVRKCCRHRQVGDVATSDKIRTPRLYNCEVACTYIRILSTVGVINDFVDLRDGLHRDVFKLSQCESCTDFPVFTLIARQLSRANMGEHITHAPSIPTLTVSQPIENMITDTTLSRMLDQ